MTSVARPKLSYRSLSGLHPLFTGRFENKRRRRRAVFVLLGTIGNGCNSLKLLTSSRLDAGCHAEPADARQLQRRSTDIKPEDGTKKIDLKAFDPTDRKTKIAPQ